MNFYSDNLNDFAQVIVIWNNFSLHGILLYYVIVKTYFFHVFIIIPCKSSIIRDIFEEKFSHFEIIFTPKIIQRRGQHLLCLSHNVFKIENLWNPCLNIYWLKWKIFYHKHLYCPKVESSSSSFILFWTLHMTCYICCHSSLIRFLNE